MSLSILSLPTEVLIECMRYLDVQSLGRIACVCKEFEIMSKDDEIWFVLYSRRWKVEKEVIPSYSQPEPELQSWSMSSRCIRNGRYFSWKDMYEENEMDTPSILFRQMLFHTDEVWFAAWSNDGKYFCSCSKDHTAVVWKFEEESCNVIPLQVLRHDDPCSYASFSPDSKHLITCSTGNELLLWRIREVISEDETCRIEFIQLEELPNDPYDVCANWLDNVRILKGQGVTWSGIQSMNIQEERDVPKKSIKMFQEKMDGVKFTLEEPNPTEVTLPVAFEQQLSLWNIETNSSVLDLSLFFKTTNYMRTPVYCRSTQQIFFITGDLPSPPHKIGIMNPFTCVVNYIEAEGAITGINVSEDGRYVAANVRAFLTKPVMPTSVFGYRNETKISAKCELRLYDVQTFKLLQLYRGHVATSSNSATTSMFLSFPDFLPPHFGQEHSNNVAANENESHGRKRRKSESKRERFPFCACGSENNKGWNPTVVLTIPVYVWHTEHGILLRELAGHTSLVSSARIHPFQDIIISASDDTTVGVWISKRYHQNITRAKIAVHQMFK